MLFQIIMGANIEGGPTRARRETKYLDNILVWTGSRNIGNLLSSARYRETFADIVKKL